MNEKILFVDDDANLLASMERNLRRRFNLETAPGGEAGLKKMAEAGPFAVVISDRQMPNMDGLQFLATVRQRHPDTIRIMLTGNVNLEQAVQVVNEGAIFRFVIKPCPADTLARVIDDAIAQYRLVQAERELLDKTLNGSVKLLTDILSMVDAKSFGRAETLRGLITEISKKMPLPDLWEIQLAAMLSFIGNVTLPPETLAKGRAGQPLSKSEELLIDSIPAITARLIANIPRMEGVAKITKYQQKQFNGGGFPNDGTQGEAIPQGARLLKILNDMLYLESEGFPRHHALDKLTLRQGWYDPQLLTAIRASFGVIGKEPAGGYQTISIAAADLASGMTLGSDVQTKDGTLILSAGHAINEMILERIRNFKALYGVKEPIFVRAPQF